MANIAQPLFSIHKIIVLSIVLLTYTVVINILYSYPTIRILTIIIAIVGAIFNYKKIMEITMKIIKK